MTPRLSHILLGALLAVGLLGAVAGASSCYHKKGSQAEHQAAIHQGEANAHAGQAQASDAAVADLQAKLEASKADLGRLSAERSSLLRKLADAKQDSGNQAGSASGSVETPVTPVSDDLHVAVIAKDAEVIEAQANFIKGQEAQISALVVSRDEWKAAFEAERKRAAGLEITLDAQKHVNKTGRWIGRLEGLAVGLGAGYVAGRLR